MPKTKEIPSLNDNQKPTSLLNEMDALDRINELFFGKKKFSEVQQTNNTYSQGVNRKRTNKKCEIMY